MEHKIQSLPQELRTKHPRTWTTENVCAWLTGWGPAFIIATQTQLQNGVDGGTIHEALSDTSQSPMGAVTTHLEAQFEKDLLHSKEGRQNVAAVLTKESGVHIDVEKVDTWIRNHKHKNRGSGGRGSGGW